MPRKKELVPPAKEEARFLTRMVCGGGLEVSCVSINFYETKPFSIRDLLLRYQIR
jgi:hypothetical protein